TPACPPPEVGAAPPRTVQGNSGQGPPSPQLRGSPNPVPSCPPEKPGICPLAEEAPAAVAPCGTDSCAHDRDCPRQEKCCFSGCAMRCTRPAQGERGQAGHRHGAAAGERVRDPAPSPGSPPPTEHPGECPRAEPCWDPRRRRGSQCLDDSICRREEKCCNTGCGWECTTVPRGAGSSRAGGSSWAGGSWPPAP
uniref:WAP domain-containing protein n=1 Tax=Strix occidentalis caurina TaxID=311401 RepID=A0A8D0FZ26_STROC